MAREFCYDYWIIDMDRRIVIDNAHSIGRAKELVNLYIKSGRKNLLVTKAVFQSTHVTRLYKWAKRRS